MNTNEALHMNRQKKVKDILKKKLKKKNAKLNPKNKPKYISKADREKLATEEASNTQDETSSDS